MWDDTTVSPPAPGDHVLRPAERGGQVWLIQDNDDLDRWDASWTEGEDGVSSFIGNEEDAREWARTRPADAWYEFSPELDDWVRYVPD